MSVMIAPAIFLLGLGLSYTGPDSQMPVLKMPTPAQPTAQPGLTPDQVPPGALVPQGPPPPFTVFATGDVVGYLEPCG